MKKISIALFILLLTAVACLLTACSASPSRIEVSSEPNTFRVVQGMTPDLTGGEITVTYSDGTTKTVPMTELEVSGVNYDVIGKQTAVLTYKEGEKSFIVSIMLSVEAPKIIRLEAELGENVSTEYFEGESFSMNGIKVTAYYENNTSSVVPNSACIITPSVLIADTEKVLISYHKGPSAECAVVVRKVEADALIIKKQPDVISYIEGESFDPSGMELAVRLTNGVEKDVDLSQAVFTREDETEYLFPESSSDKKVIVSVAYDGVVVSNEFTLEVTPLRPASLSLAEGFKQPVVCYAGEHFRLSLLNKINIHFESGSFESVFATDDIFGCSSDVLSEEAETVTVYLKSDPTVTLSVNVDVRKNEVVELSVNAFPENTSYTVGDVIDLTGLSLTATLLSGTKITVYPQDGIEVITKLTAETTEVEVAYGGKSVSFEVEVIDNTVNLVSMVVAESEEKPIKKVYSVGDGVNLDGLRIAASFSDGSEVTFEPKAADITTMKLFVNGAYQDSHVILEGTTSIFLKINYTDEKENVYSGEVIIEIELE